MEGNLLELVAVKHFEAVIDRERVFEAALACGTPSEEIEAFVAQSAGPWALLDLAICAQAKRYFMRPQRYLASVLAHTRLWAGAPTVTAADVSARYQLDAYDPKGVLPGPPPGVLVLASQAGQEENEVVGGTTYAGFYTLRFLLVAPLAQVDHLEQGHLFEAETPSFPVGLPYESWLTGKPASVARVLQSHACLADGATWTRTRTHTAGAQRRGGWSKVAEPGYAGGVADVAALGDGWLAVGPRGLARLDRSGAFVDFVHLWPRRAERAEALTESRIAVTSDGHVFVGTKKGLACWTPEALAANAPPEVLALGPIEAIGPACGLRLAVGGKGFFAVRGADGAWAKTALKGTVTEAHFTPAAVWIRAGTKTLCVLPDGAILDFGKPSRALSPLGDGERCLVFQDLVIDCWSASGERKRAEVDAVTERSAWGSGSPFEDEHWFTSGRAGHLVCVRPGQPVEGFTLENLPPPGLVRAGYLPRLRVGPSGDLALCAQGRVELMGREAVLTARAEPPKTAPLPAWRATPAAFPGWG